jgi:hypothetical protein
MYGGYYGGGGFSFGGKSVSTVSYPELKKFIDAIRLLDLPTIEKV